MRKAKANAAGFLMVIVAMPFVFLHQWLGWWGIGGVAIIVIGLFVWYQKLSSKEALADFSSLAVTHLYNGRGAYMPKSSVQATNRRLKKENPAQFEFLKAMQTIAASAQMIEDSKSPAVKQRHYDSVHAELAHLNFSLVDASSAADIGAFVIGLDVYLHNGGSSAK